MFGLFPIKLASVSYYLLTCTYILYAENLIPPSFKELAFVYYIRENHTLGCTGFWFVQATKSLFSSSPRKTYRWADRFFFTSNLDGFALSIQEPDPMSSFVNAFTKKRKSEKKRQVGDLSTHESAKKQPRVDDPPPPTSSTVASMPSISMLPLSSCFLIIPEEGVVFELVERIIRLLIDDYTTPTLPLLPASGSPSGADFSSLHHYGFQVIALGLILHNRLNNLEQALTTTQKETVMLK